MRTKSLAFVLMLLACAQAGANGVGDDMDRFLQDRGLVVTPARDDTLAPARAPEPMPTTPPSGAAPVADAAAPADRRAELVVAAMGALGVPYRRGGNSYNSGFDCSGFVRAMYEQNLGVTLPRQAAQQAAATQVIERSELQPGDLVFFNTLRRDFSHVGIYVGDSKFIHSPKPGAAVRIEDLRVNYWNRRFDGARRVVGHGVTPAALRTSTASNLGYPNY
jgi:cell wall-associated NlpC family hydrolase